MTEHASSQAPQARSVEAPQHQVVLSLGSNIGDRLANLQLGVDVLVAGGLEGAAVSSVYETTPVGGPPQDDYLNAVVLAVTALSAHDVLDLAFAAESAASRVRTVRFGPRTLDVDVISYGDTTSADADLTLPHPRAHERAFVLAPWLELDTGGVVPRHGKVAELIATIGTEGVRRRPDLRLRLSPQGRERAVAPCT